MTHSHGAKPDRVRVCVESVNVSDGTNEPGEEPEKAVVRSPEAPCTRVLGQGDAPDAPHQDRRGVVPDPESLFLAEGFGAYLRSLRKQAGLTQERTSDLCGLDSFHISRLERGLRRPSIPAVRALARVLAPAGEVEAIEQRLAGLAGASLRNGADRKKLQAENRNRRKAVADTERLAAKLRNNIRRQEAAGQIVNGAMRRLAEQMSQNAERLKAIPEQQPESIRGFEPTRVKTNLYRRGPYRPTFAQFDEILQADEDDE